MACTAQDKAKGAKEGLKKDRSTLLGMGPSLLTGKAGRVAAGCHSMSLECSLACLRGDKAPGQRQQRGVHSASGALAVCPLTQQPLVNATVVSLFWQDGERAYS